MKIQRFELELKLRESNNASQPQLTKLDSEKNPDILKYVKLLPDFAKKKPKLYFQFFLKSGCQFWVAKAFVG